MVAGSRELALDRADYVRRGDRIKVEGGAYRQRLAFECGRFFGGDRYELLKELSEGGRVDLFRWRRGRLVAIHAGRCHAFGEPLWAVVRFRTTKVQVRRPKYSRGNWNTRFAVRVPRSAHQPPIIIHAVFAVRKNALVKRLRKRELNVESKALNGIEYTHVLYES